MMKKNKLVLLGLVTLLSVSSFLAFSGAIACEGKNVPDPDKRTTKEDGNDALKCADGSTPAVGEKCPNGSFKK